MSITAQLLAEAPAIVGRALARGEMKILPKLEPIEGPARGRGYRNAWARNKVRKLNAAGLTERGTEFVYRRWPILALLHGKVRKLARQQLERSELAERGLTVRGTPRKAKRKIAELAGLNTGSKEYRRRYTAMWRKAKGAKGGL